MSAKLRALQARKADLVAAARKFNDETDAKAQAENRAWTDEERAQYEGMRDGIAATTASIERENALIAEEAGLGAAAHALGGAGGQAAPPANGGSALALPTGARIGPSGEGTAADPKRGFKAIGEFAQAVLGATRYAKGMGGSVDQRLVMIAGGMNGVAAAFQAATPSTYGNEGSGADGGFLIPPDFSKEIWQLSLGEDSLLPMADNTPVSGNGMSFPKDETTPWGTNGIRAYWQGEATAATATKPVLGLETLRLKKLMALVAITDEMLQDTTALNGYLPNKVAMSIRWKSNEAILYGLGNAQPFGAMNSGAVLTVVKESGQATLTLLPMNLAKMVAALPPGSYAKAVWLMNNDVLPYLFTLNSNNQILYLPYGGGQGPFQGSPYGSLMGRPIIVTQHAKSFTSQGDISLVDLSYYQAITKAEGIQTDTSMHLYFDADAMAFRTTFRMDGQSKLTAAITPANGSNSLSPFVQLGAR